MVPDAAEPIGSQHEKWHRVIPSRGNVDESLHRDPAFARLVAE